MTLAAIGKALGFAHPKPRVCDIVSGRTVELGFERAAKLLELHQSVACKAPADPHSS